MFPVTGLFPFFTAISFRDVPPFLGAVLLLDAVPLLGAAPFRTAELFFVSGRAPFPGAALRAFPDLLRTVEEAPGSEVRLLCVFGFFCPEVRVLPDLPEDCEVLLSAIVISFHIHLNILIYFTILRFKHQ